MSYMKKKVVKLAAVVAGIWGMCFCISHDYAWYWLAAAASIGAVMCFVVIEL